jgi:hypothetical protein
MTRILPLALGTTALLAVAACGSNTSASTTGVRSSASPSGDRGNNARRNAAAGELVRITGTSLLLNTQTGDITVDYSGTTPITKTHTGTVADITAGDCITATGQKDASGALTASSVLLSSKVNGSCAGPGGAGGFAGPGADLSPGASPRPSRSPRPGTPPPAFARGEVQTVSGTSVTIAQVQGGTTTITVPTTVRVSVTDSAAASDLQVGDCVLATGPRNSAGVVTARSLNIVPAGPSGCFTGGGFGGFGGRGFGGGGGGFPGGGGGGGGAGA